MRLPTLSTGPLLVLAASTAAAQVPIGSPCATSVRDTGGTGCLRASSTPTLGWLYPITNELFVDPATGHVGINTTFPNSRLTVVELGVAPITTTVFVATDSVAGTALQAQSQEGGVGVRGRAIGPFAAGMVGTAEDGTLASGYIFNAGVSGTTSMTLAPGSVGSGVAGWANNPAGVDRGVWGRTDSTTDGTGVFGEHSAATGIGAGVEGVTASEGANTCGVRGVVQPTAAGGFSAGVHFVQPHPEDAGSEIRYVCLEGNESGTYFRGSARLAGGRAWLEVPEDFRLVSEAQGLTVQVTPRGRGLMWVEQVSLDGILVRGDADLAFDYFVNGVRRGFAGHEPVQANRSFVPRYRGVPYGEELRPRVRELLVHNGILQADYTPNEALAARMGWTLVDPEEREATASRGTPTAVGFHVEE